MTIMHGKAFTLFEWLLGDAIESFAAEIFHAVFPNYFTLSRLLAFRPQIRDD